MTPQNRTLRRIALSALIGILAAEPVSLATELTVVTNPVVPDGQVGDLQHGTYPSLGVGDGDWTHVGVDLVAPCGARVYAFADGQVVDLIDSLDDPNVDSLGYMALLEHPASLLGKTFYTLYLHLQEVPVVAMGDHVEAGKTVIGRVGTTGAALACHTHFEVRYFRERLYPDWGNIYGRGDQRASQALMQDWEDPVPLFERYPAGLTAAVVADPTPSTPESLDRLRKRIATLERLVSDAPPEYLYTAEGGLLDLQTIAVIWGEMTSKLDRSSQQREAYDQLYYEAIDSGAMARLRLAHAKSLFDEGQLARAREHVEEGLKALRIANMAEQASIAAYEGDLASAEVWARAIYELSRAAGMAVGAATGAPAPVVVRVVDGVFLATDFAVDYMESGLGEAAKGTFARAAAKALIRYVPLPVMDGPADTRLVALYNQHFANRTLEEALNDVSTRWAGHSLKPIFAQLVLSPQIEGTIKRLAVGMGITGAEQLTEQVVEALVRASGRLSAALPAELSGSDRQRTAGAEHIGDGCTNFLTGSWSVPEGFGAAYDVSRRSSKLLVQVTCDYQGTAPMLWVGTGEKNESEDYVYHSAHVWKNGRWQELQLSGSKRSKDGLWFVGSAAAALPLTASELKEVNFVVGYVCTETDFGWKCGCRDVGCTTSYWQMQAFARKDTDALKQFSRRTAPSPPTEQEAPGQAPASEADVTIAPGQGVLVGRVLDAFGQSVVDATVRILGSNLRTTTDSSGGYRLPYVPGKFRVRIEKAGHDGNEFALELAQSVTYPVEDKWLIPVPSVSGLYFWGKLNWETISDCRTEQVERDDLDLFKAGVNRWVVRGTPSIIDHDGTVHFLDLTGVEHAALFPVAPNGTILRIVRPTGWEGFRRLTLPDPAIAEAAIGLEWATIGNKRPLFRADLEPGTYAFVSLSPTISGTMLPVATDDVCYMFQLTAHPDDG